MEDRLRALTVVLGVGLTLLPAVSTTPPARGAADGDARRDRVRRALWDWEPSKARRLLANEVPDEDEAARAHRLLRARLALATGRPDEALAVLEELGEGEGIDVEASLLLGRARLELGQREEARELFEGVATAYNAGRIAGAASLRRAGEALRLGGWPGAANRLYDEAARSASTSHVTPVLWARLFRSQHAPGRARKLAEEARSRREGDPRARYGLAAGLQQDGGKPARVRRLLRRLAEEHPEGRPPTRLLARHELEAGRPERARRRLDEELLGDELTDPAARVLRTAARRVAGRGDGAALAEGRSGPEAARTAAVVARSLSRLGRHEEALEVARQGIERAPERAEPHRQEALAAMRLGRHDVARGALERALERDPADALAWRLRKRYYEAVRGALRTLTEKPGRLDVPPERAELLARYLPEALGEAREALAGRWGDEGPAPDVELVGSAELFGLLRFGMPPLLEPDGHAFGRRIVARTPRRGHDWERVLRHQLAHAKHARLAEGRAPRWFDEGLALLETARADEAWAAGLGAPRHLEGEAEAMPGPTGMAEALTGADSRAERDWLLRHASRIAAWVVAREGWEGARGLLERWARGSGTAEAFAAVLELDGGVDARFRAWLDAEAESVDEAFGVRAVRAAAEARARTARAEERPDDAEARARAALAWWGRGRRERARDCAERALEDDARPHAALWVRGMARASSEDPEGARGDLQALRDAGVDGEALRTTLARLAAKAGEHAQAAEHLEAALERAPWKPGLYDRLLEQLEAAGLTERAWRWRVRSLRARPPDREVVRRLLEGAEAHEVGAETVTRWGRVGNRVALGEARHHLRFARELARLGETTQARREAETALRLDEGLAGARKLLDRLGASSQSDD